MELTEDAAKFNNVGVQQTIGGVITDYTATLDFVVNDKITATTSVGTLPIVYTDDAKLATISLTETYAGAWKNGGSFKIYMAHEDYDSNNITFDTK